jgi:hypothetical protein
MNEEAWFLDCDVPISITALKDAGTLAVISDATISGQMQTLAGVDVGSSFDFTALGSGAYLGYVSIDTTSLLSAGTQYTCVITIVSEGYTQTVKVTRKALPYVK